MLRTLPFAFALLLPFAAAAQAPNDDCSTATPIACGETLSGSTADAFPDEAMDCGTTITAPGVWYVLQGTGMMVTATTCPDNGYDTKLNVYTGNCGVITCVAGNDDIEQGVYCSNVGFAALAGQTYYILVQGYDDAVGDFDLAITCSPITFDVCQGALPIACGETLNGTTAGASGDTAPQCGTDITAAGVWYTFQGIDGQLVLTTCPNSNYDTKLNVYSGDCGALVCVDGNDDIVQGTSCSNVMFNTTAGTTYHALVQGYDGETGDFELTLTCLTCGTPQSITTSVLDVSAIINWSSVNSSLVYTIEYGTAGFTQGSGTIITGTYGADGPPVNIGGLVADTEYEFYIQEDCGNGDLSPVAGPIAFTTLAFPPAANAMCNGALPIACGGNVTGNTEQGMYFAGPICGAANISSNGLWYTFTGNGDDVTLSTCNGTSYDTKLSVFTGVCGAPLCVVGGDDAPDCAGNTSNVVFHTAAGTTYLVLVHGYNDAQGEFNLAMSCATPCTPVENEVCGAATNLSLQPTGGCEASTGTTVCAFAPAMENPPCDPYGNIVDTWYAFNSSWTDNLTLMLEALSAPLINVAVYTACDSPEYIECWMDVTDAIDLSALPQNTDLLLRVWNGGGFEAGTFSVCLEGDFNVGVAAANAQGQLVQLYPVPVRDVLTVQPTAGIATLAVVDLQGRTLLSTTTNGAYTAQVHVDMLAPGSYLLLGDGNMVGRFVKE